MPPDSRKSSVSTSITVDKLHPLQCKSCWWRKLERVDVSTTKQRSMSSRDCLRERKVSCRKNFSWTTWTLTRTICLSSFRASLRNVKRHPLTSLDWFKHFTHSTSTRMLSKRFGVSWLQSSTLVLHQPQRSAVVRRHEFNLHIHRRLVKLQASWACRWKTWMQLHSRHRCQTQIQARQPDHQTIQLTTHWMPPLIVWRAWSLVFILKPSLLPFHLLTKRFPLRFTRSHRFYWSIRQVFKIQQVAVYKQAPPCLTWNIIICKRGFNCCSTTWP